MSAAAEQRAVEILGRLQGVEAPRVVELGCQRGILSNLLLSRPDLHLTMVDNWLPGDAQPDHYRSTRDSNAHLSSDRARSHRAQAFAVADKAGSRARIWEMDTLEASLRGETFDLVFIDADHSETGVAADIAAWRPLARVWIGGHDYENGDDRFDFSGVKRAVDAVFSEVERGRNYTWWARP